MLTRKLLRYSHLWQRSFAAYPDHEILRMPALSPTMESGVISKWLIEPPQEFSEGDPFCTIDTDKASLDFESQEEGFLAKILVPAGTDMIAVGEPIGIVVEEEKDVSAFENYVLTEEAETSDSSSSVEVDQKSSVDPDHVDSSSSSSHDIVSSTTAGLTSASPAARHHANLHNIDLSQLSPTGRRNYIQKQDVMLAIEKGLGTSTSTSTSISTSTSTPLFTSSAPSRIDLTPMRKTIASRLTESWQNIPYYSLSMDIDMTNLMEARKDIDTKLSVTDLLVKACDKALQDVPEVNRHWIDDSQPYMLQHYSSDISVAVATDAGLVTPVIRNVNQKTLGQIASESQSLIDRARTNQLDPAEYQGGTFTISNLGGFGIRSFTAIINPPQSAILAVGSGRNENDRSVTTMTLGCDHRVIDGAVGSEWLGSLKNYIEKPCRMLV